MNKQLIQKQNIKFHSLIRAPQRKDLILSLLTLVISRANILGFHPFGCIMMAALAKKDTAYLFIPAILIGSLTSGAMTLKYLLTAFIICGIKIFMTDKNKVIEALIYTGALFISGFLAVLQQGTYITGISSLLMECVFAAISYSIFTSFKAVVESYEKNEASTKENALSFVIVIMTALWGLSGINLPYSISLKAVLGIYMILCLCTYSEFSICAAFAIICGFVSNSASLGALSCAGIFGVSAILASLLNGFGQLGTSIGFMSGITISMLYVKTYELLPISVADVVISVLGFGLLSSKFNRHIGVFLSNTFKFNTAKRDLRIKEYITEELNSFSNTFSEFARQFKSSFQKGTENISSPSALFDETAQRICSDCKRFSDCWQKYFNDTYKYMFSILDTIERDGEITCDNAPIVFVQRCVQPELFLNEFNHVYEMNKLDMLQKGIRFGERSLVSNQYVEISKVIKELSEEIEGNFIFDEQKEKLIISECSKEALYLKDLSVIRDSEGYYEVYFSSYNNSDLDMICEISSNVLGMKMKKGYSKNKSIEKLVCDDNFFIELSFFQKEKDTEPVCGDTITHFKTDKGKYYVILCDGMGSGCDASRESRMTSDLLSGFLKAGFSKNIAINLINSTLALKMDREGFSTIDLCEIDLRSGRAEFIKIGGAQSYIKAGDTIETVFSKGMPAGIIESISSDNITIDLENNNMIVMVSDGVSEAGYGIMRGEWVKGLMKSDLDTKELAKSIVTSARKKIYPRTPDDMSAVVITLHSVISEKEEISA